MATNGSVIPPISGQAVSATDGAFGFTVTEDVPGTLLCSSTGGNNGQLPAPNLAVALADGITAGGSVYAHINPFTTVVSNRVRAGGDFSPATVRAIEIQLSRQFGLGGPVHMAAYGATDPDAQVITRLLNGFDEALVALNALGGGPLSNADALIAALERDLTDNVLDGQASGQAVTVNGSNLIGLSGNLSPTPGNTPIANAGADVTVVPGTLVALSGAASSDLDGDLLSYLWRIHNQPPGADLALGDPSGIGLGIVPTVSGSYFLSLTVSDGTRVSLPDVVRVDVTGGNLAPIAQAGADTSGASGASITLDGSASSDPDGDLLGYTWHLEAQPSGGAGALSDPSAIAPNFTAVAAGEYVLSLTVFDGIQASVPDLLSVTIIDANQAPIANAGADVSGFAEALISLDGSASSDPDNDPLGYDWQLISQPPGAAVALLNNAVVAPEFTPIVAGDYLFSLTVSDGTLISAPDTVIATVGPPNPAPMAVAGADRTLTAGASITLDGAASYDPNGDPISYLWQIDTAPHSAVATLATPSAAQTVFTPQWAGDYVIALIVNDGAQDSLPDTVLVTALPGVNRAPVANAGLPRTIPAGNQVVLDGDASGDPDADAITYLWQIDAQPAGALTSLSSNTAPRPSFTPTVAGDYDFSLTVNDGILNSAPASVRITVSPAPNRAPVADAGADLTSLRSALVSLNGNGSSDLDGDALSFLWGITSQPVGAGAALSGNNIAQPSFIPTLSGSYVFSLIVNDGALDSAPDPVTVTVSNISNRVPVASAGLNQSVTVFTLVNLDGSTSGDPDGDPISHLWSLTSSPIGSVAVLSATDTATTGFTPGLAGDYVVTLVVSDGALDSAPVSVTITAADSVSAANYVFDGQTDNDWLGYAVAGPGDMNGDGVPDLAVGAFNNGAGAGQVQVFSGANGGVLFGLTGQAPGDFFGRAIAAAGDVDADGVADLIIGAHGNATTATGAGMVQVITGVSGTPLYTFYGDLSGDSLGKSVAGAGDVNSDGHDDVMAGSSAGAGMVKIFSGIDGGVFHTLSGANAGDKFGFAMVGLGDVNGDGSDDIAIGAPGVSTTETLAGQVIIYNGLDGTVIRTLDGASAYGSFGQTLANAGDVNGDGVADLLVAAPNHSDLFANGGQVTLFSGANGTVLLTLDGAAASDQFGITVAGIGDSNGDGVPDIAVGAPGNDTTGTSAGQIAVFSAVGGALLTTIDGIAAYDGLGRSVAAVGDVDRDGLSDMLGGAPGHDAGAADAGRAEVFFGSP
jgi:hypothetical protein